MTARKIKKKTSSTKKIADVEFALLPRYEKAIREMEEKFSPFAMVVFLRTYARKKADDTLESWQDLVIRVINSTFYFKKTQTKNWNEQREQRLAFDMAKAMFNLQWLPPGRGLWAMQKDYIKKFGNMALNNCGFVSTEMSRFGNISLAVAIKWMMDASMLGVGVGFDCDWNGTVYLPNRDSDDVFVIEDSRQGWSESTNDLLLSYLLPNQRACKFDYSLIRPEGAPIKGFGGVAAGPQVLVLAHRRIASCMECYYRCQQGMGAKESIRMMLKESYHYETEEFKAGFNTLMEKFEAVPDAEKTYRNARLVADLFNIVGVCVVSGNVRRSAEVALAEPSNVEFLNLKNYAINPEREYTYGWMSNNSARIEVKEHYEDIVKNIVPLIIQNGEPGIVNLIKANAVDPKNPKKKKDRGVNPCVEITLMAFELCCLAEVFGINCIGEDGKFSMEIFLNACKFASIYASIVSCIPSGNQYTDEVVSVNHRIGVSQSGLFTLYDTLNRETYIEALERGFNTIKLTCNKYVHDFCGVTPIAVSTVKPSGTISILAASLAGVHPAIENRYIMRRIRIGANLPIAKALLQAGVPHEKSKSDGTVLIFLFPIDQGEARSAREVSMWEQCMMALEVQNKYSDNGVSLSLYFERSTESDQLPQLIRFILPYVKGISFMPKNWRRKLTLNDGHELLFNPEVPDEDNEMLMKNMEQFSSEGEREFFNSSKSVIYEQPPFTAISKEEYERTLALMPAINTTMLTSTNSLTASDGASTKYCDALKCSI